jgi:tryptophan synthase alpha chain
MSVNTLSEPASLQGVFSRCRAENRAALIPFVPAGHPSVDSSLDVLLMLADEGADIIELGIPFSDPLADGPIIQRASFNAIAHGVDLPWTLSLLRRFREQRDTPIVLFSYLNPILHYGLDRFLADAVDSGAQGLLLTDLPVGADLGIEASIAAAPLDLVRLIAPTTPQQRIESVGRDARGFVYYISRTGVTGVQTALAEALESEVRRVRDACAVPVAVGFGISSNEHAAAVAAVAEGVVVGSALVDVLEKEGLDRAREFVRGLRGAVVRDNA